MKRRPSIRVRPTASTSCTPTTESWSITGRPITRTRPEASSSTTTRRGVALPLSRAGCRAPWLASTWGPADARPRHLRCDARLGRCACRCPRESDVDDVQQPHGNHCDPRYRDQAYQSGCLWSEFVHVVVHMARSEIEAPRTSQASPLLASPANFYAIPIL